MDDTERDKLLQEQAVREYVRKKNEESVQKLIENAETYFEVDKIDVDELRRCFNELWRRDSLKDETNVLVGIGAKAFFGLVESSRFLLEEAEECRDSVRVGGVECRLDPTLPDNTALVIHHDALAPSLPRDHQPFLVRDPGGIVVLEEESKDD